MEGKEKPAEKTKDAKKKKQSKSTMHGEFGGKPRSCCRANLREAFRPHWGREIVTNVVAGAEVAAGGTRGGRTGHRERQRERESGQGTKKDSGCG